MPCHVDWKDMPRDSRRTRVPVSRRSYGLPVTKPFPAEFLDGEQTGAALAPKSWPDGPQTLRPFLFKP